MAKDRRNDKRKAAHRRSRSNITNPTTSASFGPREVAGLIPLSIPWVSFSDVSRKGGPSADGSCCVAFRSSDSRRGFAVFDSEELLSELIMLVGPPGLGYVDLAFLREFIVGRRELSDPTFAELSGQDIELTAPGGAGLTGSCELRYWRYTPFDVACDGSRSVLVRDVSSRRTLMVVNRDGQVIDGMWIDPLLGKDCDADWHCLHAELTARRREVNDPAFASAEARADDGALA